MSSCQVDDSDDEDVDGDVGGDGNDGHLCRLAMRADVKEWGCHFRPRDLIHRSEVDNKAEHDDPDGEGKVS